MRVVSLLPSATEIMCALGAQSLLAGRSHECDYPPGIRHLPVCTKTHLQDSGSSRRLDEQVKARLAGSLSIFDVDVPRLNALRPDLLLTQAQCEVCAISEEAVRQALPGLQAKVPAIVSLSPARLVDIWTSIADVARAIDRVEEGRVLLRQLKTRVVEVIEKTCVMTRKPTVCCIEWMEPLMAAGNWVPELVEMAGGRNVAGEVGKHSPWMEWAELQRLNPEVIVLMPCGFNLERTRSEMSVLQSRDEWRSLQAVKEGHVYLVDGNHYFNRPGPRVVESFEILARLLHPHLFPKLAPEGWELWKG